MRTLLRTLKMTTLSGVLLGVIGVLLLVYGIGVPLRHYDRALDERLDMLTVQHASAAVTAENMERYQQLYTTIHQGAQQKRTGEEETALFLKEVEGLMQPGAIVVRDIKPLSPSSHEQKEGAAELAIEVTLESSLQDMVGVLYRVATSEGLVRITRMDIAGDNKRAGTLAVKLVFVKTLFV